MPLNQNKLAQKKAKREGRRKKLAEQHNLENRRMVAGDYTLYAQRIRRSAKNRRNHHMPKFGINKRSKPQEGRPDEQ